MFIQDEWSDSKKIWVTFIACFGCAAVGVVLSFLLLGSTLTGVKLWGFSFAITVVMLGLAYGAKYADPVASMRFTPMDLLQFISQGFLWPSTWPALASRIGIDPIERPEQESELLLEVQRWLA